MSATNPDAQLVERIKDRLERMQALELEQISITHDLEHSRRLNRYTECSYILDGIEGNTETVRKAGLDLLLRDDPTYKHHRHLIDKATQQSATLTAALADHKRQLALEMELLRHMRPGDST